MNPTIRRSLISTILYSISLNKKLVTRHSQQNSKSVESELLPGVRLACEWADTLVSCAAAGSPAGGEGGRQGEEESPFAGPSSDNRLADWHRRGGEVSRPRWPSPPPWPPAPYLPHTTLDSANSEKNVDQLRHKRCGIHWSYLGFVVLSSAAIFL